MLVVYTQCFMENMCAGENVTHLYFKHKQNTTNSCKATYQDTTAVLVIIIIIIMYCKINFMLSRFTVEIFAFAQTGSDVEQEHLLENRASLQ